MRAFSPKPSGPSLRVVVSTWAWWLRLSPSRSGRWMAASTATPCRSASSRAKVATSSRRCSAVNSSGKASSNSRATVLFFRVSDSSAPFHRAARSEAQAGAFAGKVRSADTTPERRV